MLSGWICDVAMGSSTNVSFSPFPRKDIVKCVGFWSGNAGFIGRWYSAIGEGGVVRTETMRLEGGKFEEDKSEESERYGVVAHDRMRELLRHEGHHEARRQ